MGMTGLQIYKLLPKSNCAKCGYSTCIAFGMAVAAGKTAAEKCPDMPDSLRIQLEEGSLPPVREAVFGVGERAVKIGGEKVVYRHEETFFNPACIAVRIDDTLSEDGIRHAVAEIAKMRFERAGEQLAVNAVALRHAGGDLAKAVSFIDSDFPLILISSEEKEMENALKLHRDRRLLAVCYSADNAALLRWSTEYGAAVAVCSADIHEALSRAEELSQIKNLVLCLCGSVNSLIENSVDLRRSAVIYRQKSFPVMALFDSLEDEDMQITAAGACIVKYVSCVVVSTLNPDKLLPLLTLRSNIYTDPRKPVQVEPGLYEINNPDADSPVLVTTNFSLTHFLVSSETEASRIPSWVIAVDTDGTSLLTAWAADKFNAQVIAKAVEKSGIADRVKHRSLIMSAHVALLKSDVEKETSWSVILGPADSAGLSSWLKNKKNWNTEVK